ncbi:MAG TPA: DUF2780 domain-containing protein [Steroidobacteraceae bacterium]|jgi:hypothetical protein|nr:DUF2780 domain-containing protein [Steroidobacteraceae bacterium]
MQDLVAQLSQKLKIDETQARGGAAILFKAAQDKLGGPEFQRLLGSVPGLDALVKQAPKSGGGLLGGLASLAGGNAALLATIVSGFSRLKMSSGQAQQFVPIILDNLRTKVGAETVDKLEQTLRA